MLLAAAAVRCDASHSRVRATSATLHSGPVCQGRIKVQFKAQAHTWLQCATHRGAAGDEGVLQQLHGAGALLRVLLQAERHKVVQHAGPLLRLGQLGRRLARNLQSREASHASGQSCHKHTLGKDEP